ncbi:hypothetical protein AB6A40_001412 [Gnathostoma spinigerum]|uniref:Uncharacterized protein n=1 Tax=Gnathostoma spinigerum TaxID=75299 RepID=A0ABD6E4A0_9BILA
MVLSDGCNKLFLKVERGTKPRLKLCEESRKAFVTVPVDQSVKWPPLKAQLCGLTIVVQRLEQQYKITVKHIMERKPEVCVFVNAMTQEKDIRTAVRELSTRLNHIGIAGPNLEVTGHIRGERLTFESTVGALHTNAKLYARSVTLNAQHIFIASEAVYSCTKIRMASRRVQIDGRLHAQEQDSEKMIVIVDSSLLHIGVDGCIGSSKANQNNVNGRSPSKSSESPVKHLTLRLTGSLANHGRIASRNKMEIKVGGKLLSLRDGKIDSATRGYNALKQIKGVNSECSEALPTSSTLGNAIIDENPHTVAKLLEDGVDPNDSMSDSSYSVTPKKLAARKYREMKIRERKNLFREKVAIIQALICTHHWRRGLITSKTIDASIGHDCDDCAQFRGSDLSLTVRGNAVCEIDSIWTSGSVTMTVGRNTFFNGQIKHQSLEVVCNDDLETHDNAIVRQEYFAKISCSAFSCRGIWSLGDRLSLEAQSAKFHSESFIEADQLDINLVDDCEHEGMWQLHHASLVCDGNIVTSRDGNALVADSIRIVACNFNSNGVWSTDGSLIMRLRQSVNLFASSRLSARVLKMILNGHCMLAGILHIDNLLAYVRNDLITSSTGKVNVSIGATVAAGAFRNDSVWHSDCNLLFHLGCFEQSEDASILAKETLTLTLYDQSDERSHGRLMANYLLVQINRCLQFDGYIRVNFMELNLPYVNESQFVVGGHLEVLSGPIVIKGRSEIPDIASLEPHPFPAFILEGQLMCEAVVAPFLAVQFSHSSYALLSGMNSITANSCRTLISVGSLNTMRTSLVDSVSSDSEPEGIMVANIWLHEGQVRFRGEKVFVAVGALVNRGRLTNESRLHNHMHDLHLMVSDIFLNEAVLSANKIKIIGDGALDNQNRIFANDQMSIKLANFSNEGGRMMSDSMKLLSAGKDWTRIEGRIEGRRGVDIAAFKLRLDSEFIRLKQMRLNARAQLHISSALVDPGGSVVMLARDLIVIDADIDLNKIELLIGAAYATILVINAKRNFKAKNVRVAGKCKNLTVIVDGRVDADSIIFEETIKNVKIVGQGSILCRKTLNASGESLSLNIRQLQVAEVLGCTVILQPNDIMRLFKLPDEDSINIYTDRCVLLGQVLMEGKICIRASKGAIRLDAQLMGIAGACELSMECSDLILNGEVSNLDFVEIYAKRRVEYTETAIIKGVRSILMEGESIVMSGRIIDCRILVATGTDVHIEGTLRSERQDSNFSIFADCLRFDGLIQDTERIEFNARRDMSLGGTVENVGKIEIESTWLRIRSTLCCKCIEISAFSMVQKGLATSASISICCAAILIIYGSLSAPVMTLTAPIMLLLGEKTVTLESLNVKALLLFQEGLHDFQGCSDVRLSLRFGAIDRTALIPATVCNTFREVLATLKSSLKSPTLMLDDLLYAIKTTANVRPAIIDISVESPLYHDLKKISNKFRHEHISVFCPSNMLAVLEKNQNEFNQLNEETTATFNSIDVCCSSSLYESVERFCSRPHGMDPPSPSISMEDGGYGSRSSSEDIEDRTAVNESLSYPMELRTPESVILKLADQLGDELNNNISVQKETPLDDVRGPSLIRTIERNRNLPFANRTEAEDGDGTRYVVNGERRIPIAFVDFSPLSVTISQPSHPIPQHNTSSRDLVLKRLRMKRVLSTLDLRSFDSDSSLASFRTTKTTDVEGSKKVSITPIRKSLIPRSARASSVV